MTRHTKHRIYLFQLLFVTYSQLGLTKNTDRPVAISSLEKRLAATFKTEVRYGVIAKYLHRSLLWQRSGDTQMKRMPYVNRSVPSWSWMAYDGQIDYMSIGFRQVKWSKDVQWPEFILDAKVRDFQACKIERKDGEKRVMEDKIGSGERGWLIFDGDDGMDVQTLKCVIIGRESSVDAESGDAESGDAGSEGSGSEDVESEDVESEDAESEDAGSEDSGIGDAGRKFYVLVVKPICSDRCRDFERVGVGSVPQRFISFESGGVRGRIL